MTVYFIGGDFDRVKIGYTSSGDATGRLRDLQTGSPVVLRVHAECPGDISDERALHAALNAEREHGEWFRISERLSALIAYVSSAKRLAGWRDVLANPDAAGRLASPCGFTELGDLTANDIRLPAVEPEKINLDSLLHYWPNDSDAAHVIHRLRTGEGWACTVGWRRLDESYVDLYGKAGPRHTGEFLAEAAGNRLHEMAVWIQACLFQLAPPRLCSPRRELKTRLPCHMELGAAAHQAFPCEWHMACTDVTPEDFFLPEHCALSAREFLRMVAAHRSTVWDRNELHVLWLEGAYEAWPRRESRAA